MFTDPMVGRSVKGTYTNGCFIGVKRYFNQKLEEHVILYEDGTSDSVKYNDFDYPSHPIVNVMYFIK